jgi:hypothetical protein
MNADAEQNVEVVLRVLNLRRPRSIDVQEVHAIWPLKGDGAWWRRRGDWGLGEAVPAIRVDLPIRERR